MKPDLEVVQIGRAESFKAWEHGYPFRTVRWHFHPEFELHYVVSTSGRYFVGDFIGSFEPGNLVLTGPNLPHNWVSDTCPAEDGAAPEPGGAVHRRLHRRRDGADARARAPFARRWSGAGAACSSAPRPPRGSARCWRELVERAGHPTDRGLLGVIGALRRARDVRS